MKRVIILLFISSFLISQSLTKGWYNESFDVPGTLWTNALEVLGGTPGVGKVLTDDGTGAGIAIWSAAAGGGANTALSNLASVAINTSLILGASDGGALGSVTKQWSDLFLASGGVINWDNGDMTITHAANTLGIEGGKVGIGTASPNAALEVKGALPGSVGGFQSGTFHVTNSSAAQYSNSVITGHNAYNTNTQLWYLGSVSSSNNDIAFINRQVGVIGFDTNNTRRMTILSVGNVGIGESSPLDILHVTANNACIRLEDDSGNYGRVKVGNSQLTIQADPDNVVASTDIVFDMDGSEVARFSQGGNFGINVIDPDTQLEVLNPGNQLKLSFDGTDNATFGVDTNGDMTVTPSGSKTIFANNVTVNSNYVMEGYATGRSVERTTYLRIYPGGTPNTDLSVDVNNAAFDYNTPSVTDVTDLIATETDGQWTLSADGKDLTLNLTETVVGIFGSSLLRADFNTHATTAWYALAALNAGNIQFNVFQSGSVSKISWLTILDTGDFGSEIIVNYVTST